MTTINTQILTKMAIVNLDISAWSGRSRLDKDDFIDQSMLPPDTAVSLGSKKLIQNSIISKFQQIRSRSHRTCMKYGIPFVGGYAVRLSDIDQLDHELRDIQMEFNQRVSDLVNNFEELTNEWIKENPGFEQQLRKAMISSEKVARKFGYDFSFFQVESLPSHDLHKKASKLVDRVLDEVADLANDYIKNSLKGSTDSVSYITSRGRSILDTIQKRLRQLSFVNSEFDVVADWVKALYDKLPATGGISGDDYRQFASMLNTLTNGEQVMQTAQLFAQQPDDRNVDLFNCSAATPSPEALPAEPVEEETNNTAVAETTVIPNEPAQSHPRCDWGASPAAQVEPAEEAQTPNTALAVEEAPSLSEEPQETEETSQTQAVTDEPVVEETPVVEEQNIANTQLVVGADFMPSISHRTPNVAVTTQSKPVSKAVPAQPTIAGIACAGF
ncbi:DUF3150 domain-containing protein [Thalassospira sp. CH_XMU1420-2]|uniref:DUF3150 domain-containing protein n=1 Tax=Thalassospira sp. CH_XMU1420-2 TaxID=3107769 RepID=UPI003008B739